MKSEKYIRHHIFYLNKMVKYLFIDTNIFLVLYSYSEDQPIRLKELIESIKQKQIAFVLTEQVVNEFYRNRESKLNPSLNTIEELSLDKNKFKVPAFCSSLESIKKIKEKFDEIKKLAKEAHKILSDESKEQKLEVDSLFAELVKITTPISITELIFQKAKRRVELGNPPGKEGSLGDAINWEILLETVPVSADLIFITADKDYLSPLSEVEVLTFLKKEWEDKKKSKIVLYKTISGFLKEELKNKTVTSEEIKKEEAKISASSSPLDNLHIRSSGLFGVSDLSFVGPHPTSGGLVGSAFVEDEKISLFCDSCKQTYPAPKYLPITFCSHCGCANYKNPFLI